MEENEKIWKNRRWSWVVEGLGMKIGRMWEKQGKEREIWRRFGVKVKKIRRKERNLMEFEWKIEGVKVDGYGIC